MTGRAPASRSRRNGGRWEWSSGVGLDSRTCPAACLLPAEILWRQKEQFSDGVGYSWIDSLKELAEREVSDEQLRAAAWRFPVNPPAGKEAYLYRALFASHFPSEAAARCVPCGPSVACSTPAAIAWDPAFAASPDPSGRAVRDVHRPAQSAARANPRRR